MAWDKQYRPRTFADVLGQDGTCQVLRARILNGSGLETSYVFAGPSGTGKTTASRILARALICTDLQPDGEPCNACDNCQGILNGTSTAFRELDAASSGTIDHVRKIVEDLSYAVIGASKRIVLFDEMHRMSRDSQDVLLKPLEEKRLIGIFCTTEPHKIRPTISSRCETHTIRFPTREEILGRVQTIMRAEGVTGDEDAVLTAIDYCGGHVRDVLNRLEMISQMGPITMEAVRHYLDLDAVSVYYDILLSLGSPQTAVPLAESLCDRYGPDEVLSGLAEAAMNSWRLANKMLANFAQLDRAKAAALSAQYGDSLPSLAEYFLGLRRPTSLGVTCAILACSGGVPARQSAQTVVQLMVPAQAPPQAAPDSVPPTGVPATDLPASIETNNASPEPNIPNTASQTVKPAARVDDGLTDQERKARPENMPRGSGRQPKVVASSTVRKQTIRTPAEARMAILAKVRPVDVGSS